MSDDNLVGIITMSDCLRALRTLLAMPCQPASAALQDDPEAYRMWPMPAFGDEHPGRPVPPFQPTSQPATAK